ncbi:hypothetical protein ES705_49339 [subsurface metagenome]
MREFNLESFPTQEQIGWSGRQLKAIRLRVGLSQEQWGRKVGVSRGTIMLWENDRAKPSPLALESLKRIIESLQKHRRDMEILAQLQERECAEY